MKKEKSKVTLVTHNGLYHSDDVASAALLSLYYEKVGLEVEILRTRDESKVPEESEDNKVVVFDVFGGELDHHNNTDPEEDGRKLAALGKIWRKYKFQILRTFELDMQAWIDIDQGFIRGIDTTDNTGIMNPLSYFSNSFRQINGVDSDESFLKAVEVFKIIFISVLEAGRINSQIRKESKEILDCLERTEVKGKTGVLAPKYLQLCAKDTKDLDFIAWIDSDGKIMVKALNGFGFIPNLKNKDGVIFTHHTGFTGKVETFADIDKIIS